MKSNFAHRTLFSCLVLSGLVQAAPPLPGALPTGGSVSSGQASISTTGSSMTVNQSTNRAAINWDTFNVGQNATVNFIQPNAQSATLNRVIGNSPSQIFGQIHANGQVYLLNQAGIYFSPSAIVDVNSIVATTHQLSDADFMAGKSSFTRNGSAASVVNDGYISSGIGGYIALLAPEVRNNGVVIARQGTVAMASGEVITLNFGPLSQLESVTVSPSEIRSLVTNNHAVIAPDGLVILSARAMNQLASQVIQNGTVEAKGISNQGGRIVLDSGGNGYSEVSGILDASSTASKGGRIEVLGQDVRVKNTSTLNASGVTGGGEILIGGSWQNSDPTISQATTTNIELGANLQANATDSGNGGTIVAWSDVANPNSQTTIAGNLQAKGGINGGDGGRIETSGYQVNIQDASVNASAPKGNAGLWLIDPALVTIDQATANVFSNTLSTGNNVFVSNPTSGGDIATAPGVSISKTAGGNTFFKLQADGSITLADQTSIQSSFGTLDVILNSNSAGGGGAVSLTNATINTNGGVFTLGGNPNPLIGVARGTLNQIVGASIDGGSIFTGGGNISIRGQGYAGTPSTPITATNSSFGVRIGQNAVINSGGGNISIAGFTSVLNSNAFSHAVMFGDQGSVSGGASILSGSGNINISGTTSGGGNYSNGIYFQSSLVNPVTISATGNGTVSLSGSTNNPTHLENHGVFFEEGAQRVSTQNGLLSLTGQGSGTNGFGVAFQHNIGSNSTVIGSSTQAGNIDFNADSLFFASTTNATIQGLGNLTFKPITSTTPIEIGTASTTTKLVVPSTAFDSQISNGFSNITIGTNAGSGSITTAANITPQDNLELVSGTGAIQISNAINAGSNTLTLNSSGAITESGTGSIAADKLLILGATGTSTLQASNNSVNVLAANTGSLAYTNAGPLTIGTVGTTSGITASGAVDIATQTGNLTLANSVSSGSSASNAIVLTAGENYAAGDVDGGDITAASGVAINVAAGGSAKLYTGSFFDSTGLVDLVNAGGGSYRFNSSQTSSDFTTPLGPGVSAIYRDPFAPTLIASASSEVLSTTPSLAPILPDVSDVNIISSNANVNTVEGVGKGAGGPGDGAGPGNGAGQGKGSQGKSTQGKGATGNNAASSNSVEVSAPDVVEQTSNANINTVEGVGRGAGGPGDGSGPGNGAGQGKGAPGNNAIAPSSVDTSTPDASGQTSNANVNTVEGVGKGAGGPGDGAGPGNGAGQGRGSGNNPASANSAEISVPEASARTSNANVNTVEGVGKGAGGPGDGSGPGNGAGQGKGSGGNNGNNNNHGHGNNNHGHNQGHGSNPPPRNPPANNPPLPKPPAAPGKPSNPVSPSGPTPPKTPTTPTVPGGPTPPVTPPEIVPPLVPPVVPPYVGPTPPKTPTTPTVPGGPTPPVTPPEIVPPLVPPVVPPYVGPTPPKTPTTPTVPGGPTPPVTPPEIVPPLVPPVVPPYVGPTPPKTPTTPTVPGGPTPPVTPPEIVPPLVPPVVPPYVGPTPPKTPTTPTVPGGPTPPVTPPEIVPPLVPPVVPPYVGPTPPKTPTTPTVPGGPTPPVTPPEIVPPLVPPVVPPYVGPTPPKTPTTPTVPGGPTPPVTPPEIVPPLVPPVVPPYVGPTPPKTPTTPTVPGGPTPPVTPPEIVPPLVPPVVPPYVGPTPPKTPTTPTVPGGPTPPVTPPEIVPPLVPPVVPPYVGPTPPKTPTTPTVPGGPTPPVTPPEIVPPLVPPVVPPYVGPTPPKTPTTPTVPGGPTPPVTPPEIVPPLVPPVVPPYVGPTPPKTPTTPTVPGGPTPPVTPPEIVPPLVPPVVPPYVGPTPPKTPTTPTVPGGPSTSNTAVNTPVGVAARNASAVGNQIPYDELSVSLTRKVTPNDGGLVSVLVPKSLINNQQEFSFKLPKEVADLVDKSANVRAITNDGKELPSWLSFDKKNESFSAASSANRVLPIRVLINTDSGTTVMNISVREGP